MSIDASIYSGVQAPQPNSAFDSYEKAMRLSELGMQQAQMGQQMYQQGVLRHAYAQNTDPNTGKLDRAGFLSTLGQAAPQLAEEKQAQFAQQDKAQAEAQLQQMQATHQMVSTAVPYLDYVVNKVPEDQKARVYPQIRQQMADLGLPVNQYLPQTYDGAVLKSTLQIANQQKEQLDKFFTEAQIGKIQSETGNVEKNRLTDYQKMLGGDEQYKKASGMLGQGQNALDLIDDAVQNPASRAAVPVFLARFTTAGQRMNEQEITPQEVAKGTFGQKLKQMYTDATEGKFTQDSADYARQFITSQMASIAKNKASIENDYAGKYAIDAGIPRDTAYERLTAQPVGTVAQTPAGPARFAKNQPNAAPSQFGSGMGVPGVTSAEASEKRPANSIKPGEPYKGHIFMGGDPSDKNNWKLALPKKKVANNG